MSAQKLRSIPSSKNIFHSFTKKYGLSKTLRFELKPVHETRDRLNGFIESDTQRDRDYKELKKIIDEYHKDYIEKSLSGHSILPVSDLKQLNTSYNKLKTLNTYQEKQEISKKVKELQAQLREKTVESFIVEYRNILLFELGEQLKKTSDFKKIKEIKSEIEKLRKKSELKKIKKIFFSNKAFFGKKLITNILPAWLKQNPNSIQKIQLEKENSITSAEANLLLDRFRQFTTYLTGFHNNRKNMYNDKEQSTAIAHRIINENFPRFSSNLSAYQKITKHFPDLQIKLENIKTELKEEFAYFKIENVKDLFEMDRFNKCLTQTGIDNYNCIIGGKDLEGGKKIPGLNEKINLFQQIKTSENQRTEDGGLEGAKPSKQSLPFMQTLHKQILSDRQSHSFYDSEEFKSKKELLSDIHKLWKGIFEKKDDKVLNARPTQQGQTGEKLSLLEKIESLLTKDLSSGSYDLSKIYFKESKLSELSHSLFQDWNMIKSAIFSNYEMIKSACNHYKKSFSNQKEKKEWDKKIKSDFSIFKEEITQALSQYQKEKENKISWPETVLRSYFDTQFVKKPKSKEMKLKDFFSFQEIHDILSVYSHENEEVKEKWDQIFFHNANNPEKNILISHFKCQFSYFKTSALPELSKKLFKDPKMIQTALKKFSNKKSSNSKKEEGKQELKKDFFSFYEVYRALSNCLKKPVTVQVYQALFREADSSAVSYIKQLYSEVKNIEASSDKEFDEKNIEAIQNFLQSLMNLLHWIKPVDLEKDKKKVEDLDKDTAFYDEFESLLSKYEEQLLPLYNKSRNYITKNKNHLKKIKINFENSQLLDGWDVNKEKDYLSVILRKKENDRWLYYLGVMNKNHKTIFDYQLNFDDHGKEKSQNQKNELKSHLLATKGEEYYEKMNYKLLPDPSKMLPKVFFSNKNRYCFKPFEDIEEIKERKTYAKNNGKEFNLKDCHKLIDFYKESINKHYDWKKFNFQFSETSSYKDISDFYHEAGSQGYKLSFDKIKVEYIEEKIKTGELYLFQIYNKDFSKRSKEKPSRGKPNLHTSYFKFLFEKENLEDTVFKLNGQAEIFYRKASKKKKITHKKNTAIKNKNPNNPNKSSIFQYDLIKDNRFTEDKYFFHVPIDLNFKEKGMKAYSFNQEVLKTIKNNENINIIGIDRGERHLAYYTVIDQKGRILKQESFNKITTSYKKDDQPIEMKTDYHKLLEDREKERDQSRKLWTKIENIKELKSGYLSHLVHKISQLMIEHNAIVVFEDLNSGFKRGRMKFEKQVYQKLEKALIDKLNYLVFKDQNPKQPGGFLNAYQLTAPFESFKKMGHQTGFVLYTPAHYTSKICPLTGFVNLIYPKYENVKKSKSFFKHFEKIYFDSGENYFVFEYQDGKVKPSKKSESNALWKVCTHGRDRYKYDKKSKNHKEVDVTQKLKDLFDKYKIQYKEGKNLKEEIGQQEIKDFFVQLTKLLWLTLQLRHINPKADNQDKKDFILSPVADKTGRFFDSRRAKDDEPKNADANGAYHIALKGLKSIQGISQEDNKKGEKWKVPQVKNKEWFDFIRGRVTPRGRKAG